MFKIIFERGGIKRIHEGSLESQIESICSRSIEEAGDTDWSFDIADKEDSQDDNKSWKLKRTVSFRHQKDDPSLWHKIYQFCENQTEDKKFWTSESYLVASYELENPEHEELKNAMLEKVGDYCIIVERGGFKRRVNPSKTTSCIEEIFDMAKDYSSIYAGWDFRVINPDDYESHTEDGMRFYQRSVEILVPENQENHWHHFVNVVRHIASGSRFNSQSREITRLIDVDDIPFIEVEPRKKKRRKNSSGALGLSGSGRVKPLSDIPKPESFSLDTDGLENEDTLYSEFLAYQLQIDDESEELDAPEGFRELYDIDPQKRTVLRALRASERSDFKVNQHIIMYGPPGCGKTSVSKAICDYIGEEGIDYHQYDGTDMTQAGVVSELIGDDSDDSDDNLKVIYIEEIEKGAEKDTKWLLGLLDPERQEIRSLNARTGLQKRKMSCLVIVTVNDIQKFKKWQKGALDSRFTTQIRFPRPTRDTLKKILFKEISKIEGCDPAFAELVLRFAVDIPENANYYKNDPRKLKALLHNGMEGLYDQQFYDDVLATRG